MVPIDIFCTFGGYNELWVETIIPSGPLHGHNLHVSKLQWTLRSCNFCIKFHNLIKLVRKNASVCLVCMVNFLDQSTMNWIFDNHLSIQVSILV